MKQLALLAFLVCATATVRAQTPTSPANVQCALTAAQSPEIRSVRLGMSADKLKAAFPEDANRNAIENDY